MSDIALGRLVAVLGLDKRQFDQSMKGIDRQVIQTGRSMQHLARNLTAGLSLTAFVVAAKDAIAVSAKFQASISNLSAVTGATGKDLQFYAEQAKLIGRTTSLSASQAVTAFKLIASAKPDLLENAKALAAVTKQAVILAEAASIELPAAAKALAGSLNQFGASADEASRFINVLAAGAKFGASEIVDTADALKHAGSVASSAGISFEEMNAALQVLAEISLTGRRAGIQLRNVILELLTTTDQTNPAVVGLATALRNLGKEQLDAAELSEIFGKENVVAAQRLIASADSVEVFTQKLTGTQTAVEQARINMDNLAGDFKKLASAIEGVKIEAMEGQTGALREYTQALTELINSATDNMDDVIHGFEALTAALVAFAGVRAVGHVVALAEGIGILRGAIAGLGLAVAANPFGALAWAAAASVAVIFAYRKEIEATSEQLDELVRKTSEYDPPTEKQLEAAAAASIHKDAIAGLAREMGVFPGVVAELAKESVNLSSIQVGLGGSIKLTAKELATLQEESAATGGALDGLGDAAGTTGSEVSALAKAAKDAAKDLAKLQKAIEGTIVDLKQENADLRKIATAYAHGRDAVEAVRREIEIESEVRKESVGATKDQIEVIRQEVKERHALDAIIERNEDALRDLEDQRQQNLDDAQRAADDMQAALEEPYLQAAQSIEGAFEDLWFGIFRDGKLEFEDFADEVLDVMARLAAQVANQLIFQPQIQGNVTGAAGGIAGGGSSAAGGLGGIIGSIFGGGSTTAGGGTSGINWSALGSTAINAAGAIAAGLLSSSNEDSKAKAKREGSITPQTAAPLIGTIYGYIGGLVAAAFTGYTSAISLGGDLGEWFGYKAQNAAARASKNEVIGAAIGAVLAPLETHLLGLVLGKFKTFRAKTALLTAPEYTGKDDFEGGVYRETPFGVIGFNQPRTARADQSFLDDVIEPFAAFDEAFASILTDAQVQIAAATLQTKKSLQVKFSSWDNETAAIILDRAKTALFAILEAEGGSDIDAKGVLEEQFGEFGHGQRVKAKYLDDILARINEFVGLRNETIALRDQMFGIAEPVNSFEAALDALRLQFLALEAAAQKYGVNVAGIDQALASAIADLTIGFNAQIQREIDSILDPLSVALDDLAKQQEQRLRDARDFGADVTAVERLNALERQRVIEQFAASTTDIVQNMLDALLTGSASPLSPLTVLANAEERFAEARQSILDGGRDFGELTASADSLLSASSAVFASSAAFFERFNFVVATLQNTVAQAPGFASGGQFTVGGAGGTDNVIPLFRATPGETVTITPPGGSAGRETAIATLQASAAQADLLREVVASVRSMEARMATQQSALLRLAARAAVA